MLGEVDLRSQTGALEDGPRLGPVRAWVNAAVAAGLPRPPQGVYTNLHDLEGLAASCRRGRALGHLGRAGDPPRPAAGDRHLAYLPVTATRSSGRGRRSIGSSRSGVRLGARRTAPSWIRRCLGAARQIVEIWEAYGPRALAGARRHEHGELVRAQGAAEAIDRLGHVALGSATRAPEGAGRRGYDGRRLEQRPELARPSARARSIADRSASRLRKQIRSVRRGPEVAVSEPGPHGRHVVRAFLEPRFAASAGSRSGRQSPSSGPAVALEEARGSPRSFLARLLVRGTVMNMISASIPTGPEAVSADPRPADRGVDPVEGGGREERRRRLTFGKRDVLEAPDVESSAASPVPRSVQTRSCSGPGRPRRPRAPARRAPPSACPCRSRPRARATLALSPPSRARGVDELPAG